jgi:hypothetical protein
MLRHKAMIQAARYAFGFAGIYDPDEAERIAEGETSADIASKTKARIDDLRKQVAESVIEAEIIEGDVATPVELEHSDDAGETQDAATESEIVAEPVDELENLRANVTAALDALPRGRRNDLIAGLPKLSEMLPDDLHTLNTRIAEDGE